MSQRLSHMVYFELNDASPASIQELIDQCRQYLAGHDGQDLFAVGTLTPDLNRPVNDRDFHVSLHTIFADRAAHDAYQVHPRHLEFIERNKANWKKVRVFDSDLVD
ncbi:MAG: Dabb family protein [Planctomycetota bacterium]|nr:MAG: Dabb family protein [Planctomycetota bacterium]